MENYDEKESDTLLFILIEEFAGISKARVFSEPELNISESELLKIHFAVKELNTQKPIQYILGKAEFFGFPISVNPDVLIPRPETEELVDLVIRENKETENLHILDVGTGSGCIAIALYKNLTNAEVFAIDNSFEAIQTAKSNAELNGATINFVHLDFLNKGKRERMGLFDLIVSNPPYVRHSEKKFMRKNVLNFEPENALFVDDENPLIFYSAIADFAREYLNKKGKIYCEINQYLGREVLQLFDKSGFSEILLIRDLNGNDRFIKVQV
jgi:release factor glutamine methyltransferase